MTTSILTKIHPDHRAHFVATAAPELIWYGTDLDEAETAFYAAPKPSTRTTASDGTIAVWALR